MCSLQVITVSEESRLEGLSIAMGRERLWGLDRSLRSFPETEKAVTGFLSAYYGMMHSFVRERPVGNKELLNLFALYAGAVVGSSALPPQPPNGFRTDIADLCFSTKKLEHFPRSIDSLIKRIQSNIGPEDTSVRVASAFSTVEKDILDHIVRYADSFQPDLDSLQSLAIQYGDMTFTGFNHSCRSAQPQRPSPRTSLPSTRPVIIGNADAVSVLDEYLNIVGLYDLPSQSNPFFVGIDSPRPLSLLLNGRPGVGKTLLIRYMEAGLRDISSVKGLSYNPYLLTPDFKDRWHGSDARHLASLFTQLSDLSSLSSLAVDDGESIFSRRDQESALVEMGNVQSFLSFLNGVSTAYRGNYLVMLTTNCPDRLDPALRERFTSSLVLDGPQTPQDYCDILKLRTGPFYDYIQHAKSFGVLCRKYSLSGRQVDNIAQAVVRYVRNAGSITPDMMTLPLDAKLSALKQIHRTVTADHLLSLVESEHCSADQQSYL